jgi:hypothetical protein
LKVTWTLQWSPCVFENFHFSPPSSTFPLPPLFLCPTRRRRSCRPCAAHRRPPALLRAEPHAASAQRHRFPEPRWPLPAVPHCPAICPSHSLPPLQHQRHLLLPVNPTRRSLADRRLNYPLPSSARATLTSLLSELRRGLHARRRPPNITSCPLCPL